MAKRGVGQGRKAKGPEVAEAVSDAVVRAVHHAPESLLRRFEDEAAKRSARRLALRIVMQLAGDGWGEKRKKVGSTGMYGAVAAGLVGAGPHILAVLPEVRRVNGKLLDGVGRHAGDSIAATMRKSGVRLKRTPWPARPRSPARRREAVAEMSR
jgi:hypothetical protein